MIAQVSEEEMNTKYHIQSWVNDSEGWVNHDRISNAQGAQQRLRKRIKEAPEFEWRILVLREDLCSRCKLCNRF